MPSFPETIVNELRIYRREILRQQSWSKRIGMDEAALDVASRILKMERSWLDAETHPTQQDYEWAAKEASDAG